MTPKPSMTDIYGEEKRSKIMSRIRSRDTIPERRVRSALHRMGYRFRLDRRDLPGRPDIVLPRHGTLIFVHGCFWHQHEGCSRAALPKSNADFWKAKLTRNRERDQEVLLSLERLGWRVLTLWTCELPRKDSRLEDYLRELMLRERQ